MQGAPGCALDGFIRNTVADLCDIKTIQGRASTPDPPLCKAQKYLGARGGEKKIALSASAFPESPITAPFPPKDAPPMQHMLEWTLAPRKMGRHCSLCRWARTFPLDSCGSTLKDVVFDRVEILGTLRSSAPWDRAFPFWRGPWQLRWAALVWLSLSITLRESRAGKLGRNILHCLPSCRSLTCAWLVLCKRRSPPVDKILPTRRFSLPG